jgi:hypothetical protein
MGKLQRLRQPIMTVLRQHPVPIFVETGTFHCESLEYALTLPFQRWHSIELAPKLHSRAVERLGGRLGLTLHQGDSAAILPQLLAGIRQPAFLWLDAHFCFLETARGPKDCPLLDEIAAISSHERETGVDHIIVIDDYHILGTGPDSPWLVSDDVIFVPEVDWTEVTLDAIKSLMSSRAKQFHAWGDALFVLPAWIETVDVEPPPDLYARAPRVV